jgi:PEGA domain.
VVEKEGYVQPDERWVMVGANQITEVEFNLTPITGKIAVSSVPTNASIILNGEATGLYTDTVMEEVPVGEHTIELVLPGYRNATRTVVVEEDEYSILDLVLIPVNESVPETLPEASMNATPGNATQFSLLGPFEFRGRVDVLPANISTTANGSVVSYRLPDGAKGGVTSTSITGVPVNRSSKGSTLTGDTPPRLPRRLPQTLPVRTAPRLRHIARQVSSPAVSS